MVFVPISAAELSLQRTRNKVPHAQQMW